MQMGKLLGIRETGAFGGALGALGRLRFGFHVLTL